MPSHYPVKDDKQMLNVCTALAVLKKKTFIGETGYLLSVLFGLEEVSFFFLNLSSIQAPFISSLKPG